MTAPRFLVTAIATLALAACGAGHGTGGPAAPTGLTAEPRTGGAHLTWTDNADNETEFMVMRMKNGVDTDYAVTATVPFDTEQYHDAPLTSGGTYMYMIMAMNDDGESESDEVAFNAP